MWTLPKEMYAEISRWLRDEPSGNIMRILAGSILIKDIRYGGCTHGNCLLHSFNDEPAVILEDGESHWYAKGKLHRVNGPAVICANGNQQWYINGQLHRENDQPAIMNANGDRRWYVNGKLHRENDLPAVILANGTSYW